MSTTKMERSPERWAGMDPVVVADGSGAQIRWVIQDAKHDIAFLLQDLAAHEASNRIKTENLETLREQNAKLREGLRWTVASLSAAASAYQKHASRHNTVRPRSVSDPFFTTRSRDFAAAVEVARAALGESDG